MIIADIEKMITWCYLDDDLSPCLTSSFLINNQNMANLDSPILGSTLLQIANEKNRKRKRVGTSFDSIDSALKGGVDYGQISCISGDKGMGKTTVYLSLLSSTLSSLLSSCLFYSKTSYPNQYF